MTIEEFNALDMAEARKELQNCCASAAWVECMINLRPFPHFGAVIQYADVFWAKTNSHDWLEAFDGHPRIGDPASLKAKYAATSATANEEQSGVLGAPKKVIDELAKLNAAYEEKFDFTFIVCATGKSAAEMLEILQSRMANTHDEELKCAAKEQSRIMRLRLEKLFL